MTAFLTNFAGMFFLTAIICKVMAPHRPKANAIGLLAFQAGFIAFALAIAEGAPAPYGASIRYQILIALPILYGGLLTWGAFKERNWWLLFGGTAFLTLGAGAAYPISTTLASLLWLVTGMLTTLLLMGTVRIFQIWSPQASPGSEPEEDDESYSEPSPRLPERAER